VIVIATAFQIPVVNIADARPEASATARAFCDALEYVGFVSIVGHGVYSALIETTYGVPRQFFAPPPSVKMRSYPPEQVNGYLPVGIESVALTLDAA
jgi:isopenicillin N synthase-like dioxygenase